jgi:Domain of unknown function (DUF4440)
MMPDASSAVLAAESQRCAAMLAKDTERLNDLIDPRLHFSHATGAIDDKAGYLTKFAAGRIAYLSIEWSEQNVVSLGRVALLTGRMTSRVRVEGTEKRLENRVLAVWRYEDTWRLLAFQSTPLVK